MLRLSAAVAALILAALPALAQGPAGASAAFKDKTITMIIGNAPGGGTDASGRLIAPFLAKHLPGKPSIVVQNMPGADGVTALNYLVMQAKHDGSVITMGASTQIDVRHTRSANAHYDPTKFAFIGGVGRGGTVFIIATEAEKRLYDKSAPPVIIGVNGGVPRSGMLMAVWGIEYLGWNAKWVLGYGETNALTTALERGEIDMTSTANMFQIKRLLDSGKIRILTQSGTFENGKPMGRPDFGDTPIFAVQIDGKITGENAQKAFAYWRAINTIDKWLALPPDVPAPIVAAYREAYRETAADPEFIELGKKISEDFTPQSHEDVEALVADVQSTPPEAVSFTDVLLRKQGVNVQ